MDDIRYLSDSAIVIRIILSLFLGGILGFERGLKNRPAGLRTYILVCMGSCIVMMTNQYVFQAYGSGDPVRMAAQVISGIGFLGAGTIIVTQRNQIKGLTTAAGLWASACIGLAIGIGLYEVAIIGGFAIFIVLTSLNHWDNLIHNRAKNFEAYIELPSSISFSYFISEAKIRGIIIANVQFEPEEALSENRQGFICTLRSVKKLTHADVIKTIQTISSDLSVVEI